MRSLKIVAILVLLCFVALFAFGCVEDFSYTTYVDDVGAVHREYLVRYDASAEDAEQVKEEVVRVMRRYVFDQGFADYAEIDTDVDGEVCLYLIFPSQTDYEIAFGYTGREANEPLVPVKKGIIDRYDIEYPTYLTQRNVDYVRTLLSEEYADVPFTCEFYFTYGTTSKTTTSNGEVKEENGIFYHTWKLEPGVSLDAVISVYSWNVVALISIIISVFVLSLAIIFVIIIINKKKNRKVTRVPDQWTDDIGAHAE